MITKRTNKMITSYLSFSGRSKCSVSAEEYLAFRKQALEEEMIGMNEATDIIEEEPVRIEKAPILPTKPQEEPPKKEEPIRREVPKEKKIVAMKNSQVEEPEKANEISDAEQELLLIMQAIEG